MIGVISSQPFVINKLDGLKFGLDASDLGTVIASGDDVSRWNDKSPQGNNVFQPTMASQPQTGIVFLNGKNTILFNGINSFMQMNLLDTAFLTIGDRTVIAVIRVDEAVLDGTRIGNIFGNFQLIPNTNLEAHTTGRLRIFWDNGVPSVFSGPEFDLRKNSGVIVGARRSSIANTLYFNHELAGSGIPGNPVGLNKPFRVGADFGVSPLPVPPDTAPRIPFKGAIAELIVYDNALSDSNRRQVDEYLSNKWGIALSFIPTNITDLLVWLDGADSDEILDSGGFVSQWNDKSLLGNNATQLIMARQPQTQVNNINGVNVIAWDIVDDSLEFGSNPDFDQFWLNGGTIIFVSQSNSLGEANVGRFFDKEQRWRINKSATTGNGNLILSIPFSTTSVVFATVDDSFPAPFDPSIVVITYDGSNVANVANFFINGAAIDLNPFTPPAGTMLVTDLGPLRIGNRHNPDRAVDADFGEIIFYNRIITPTEQFELEQYLSDKWAIELVFQPDDIVGRILHLDADDAGTIEESGGGGTGVSKWKDKSGQGNDIPSNMLIERPATGIDTINGRNVITFDGVDDLLNRPGFAGGALPQPNTIFIVWELPVLPSAIKKIIDGGIDNNRHVVELRSGNEWSMFAGAGINGSPREINTPYITSSIFNGAFSEGYINGVLDMTGDVGAQPLNGISIGGRFSFSGFLNVKIAELIVYDHVVLTEERLLLEKYLSNKWAIALSSPPHFDDLDYWYDASDESTIDVGAIFQWDSKFGSRGFLVGNIVAPTTGIHTINGKNVLAFDGIDDRLFEDESFVFPPNMTYFIVANVLSSSSFFESILHAETIDQSKRFQIDSGETGKFLGRLKSDGFGIGSAPSQNLDLLNTPSIMIYRFSANDSDITLRVNGTSSDTSSYNGDPGLVPFNLLLGVDFEDSAFSEVDIAEVFMYSRDLPLAEIEALETYLSNKWGIPLGFPQAFSNDFSNDFA